MPLLRHKALQTQRLATHLDEDDESDPHHDHLTQSFWRSQRYQTFDFYQQPLQWPPRIIKQIFGHFCEMTGLLDLEY